MSRLRSATGLQPPKPRPDVSRPGYVSVGARAPSAAQLTHHSLLDAPPGALSERAGRRAGDHAPVLSYCAFILAGFAFLAALMIGLGFLLVDVLLPIHVIGHSDEAVNEWLAAHRTSRLSDASFVGSSIGDIPFIPALVVATGLAAAALRRWRVFGFIVGAILIEIATYRVTSLIVHRQRPDVPRLNPDHLPVNQSFPSGHVAASFVVYIGLALLISSHVRSRGAALALWSVAIALPLAVALSRMYRGMHHPLDATAGVLMGLSALAIALFATRAAGEAARAGSATTTQRGGK